MLEYITFLVENNVTKDTTFKNIITNIIDRSGTIIKINKNTKKEQINI